MSEKVFESHEFKTIEVDVEKNIFRINGEDFAKNCTGFSLRCRGYKDFEMEIDTTILFESGKKIQQEIREKELEPGMKLEPGDVWGDETYGEQKEVLNYIGAISTLLQKKVAHSQIAIVLLLILTTIILLILLFQ